MAQKLQASTTSEPRTLVTHPELKSRKSFPFFETVGEAPKNALEKLLSLFADVRAGEGVSALLLAAGILLLLASYSLMKPARDGLILSESGAEVKSYASAAQALLLMGIVPLYGWLSTHVVRIRLIAITIGFFVVTLVLFAGSGQAGFRVGVPFYVWLGIINFFIVSQFWAFSNDLYAEGQGRRLFPMIGVGQSLGALIGSSVVPPLVTGLNASPYTLMIIGAVVLVTALGLIFVVNAREAKRTDSVAAATDTAALGKEGGFELVLKDRYLFWIALLVLLLNLVNTTGNYVLDKFVLAAAPADPAASRQFTTAFSGYLNTAVNILGLILQLFVSSRVIRYMGVRQGLFILPVLALMNYAIIAVAPIFAVVRIGKTLENSTDYSIQNTVRQALFLPTSREAKYKAKAAIDTFFARAGDALSGGLVYLGTLIGVTLAAFAWFNVAACAIWMVVAARVAREHRRKTV
jgi:ATP:ADP antiporter, AAA family